MARPIKNNLDYFPHENGMRNDKKLKAVRVKFGIEGYAIYNMILEALSESELLVIKFDEISIELLSGDFGIDSAKLTEFLDYFVRINLLQKSNGWIHCSQLERRASPVFEKRMRFLCDLRVENGVNIAETIVSDAESTQSKVKESKGKKSKGKDIGSADPSEFDLRIASVFIERAKENFKTVKPDVSVFSRSVQMLRLDGVPEETIVRISEHLRKRPAVPREKFCWFDQIGTPEKLRQKTRDGQFRIWEKVLQEIQAKRKTDKQLAEEFSNG